MKKVSDIILASFFSFKGFAQGITSDTTVYLSNGNIDKFTSRSFSSQTDSSRTVNSCQVFRRLGTIDW